MSLYDDVVVPDFIGTTKTEVQSEIASWNSSSLKLLQNQVEATKKRQQLLGNTKKEKSLVSLAHESKKYAPKSSKESNEPQHSIAITEKSDKIEDDSLYAKLEDEYDPLKPNDYEKAVREREIIEEKKRKSSRHSVGSHSHSRSSHSSSSSSEDERKHKRNRRNEPKERSSSTMKAAFAPPPCLLEEDANRSDPSKNDGLLKAEKMMVKMGYKGGEGLGKNKQGISTALQVEKTGLRTGRILNEKEIEQPSFAMPKETKNSPNASSQPVAVGIRTDVMKNMSRVILLRNMVMPGEVDDELEGETKEECKKYGDVNKVVIAEFNDKPKEEAVRIFVEFRTTPSAIKALTDLNGRYFGGRLVKATFYNFDKYARLEYNDDA